VSQAIDDLDAWIQEKKDELESLEKRRRELVSKDGPVETLDVDGVVTDGGRVVLIGNAHRWADGTWTCLADVHGMFCRVEIKVKKGEEK
jgi:hypothetical protein